MFYRVDYMLAVLLAGIVLGLATGRRSSHFSAPLIARSYFKVVLVLLGLRLLCFVGSMVQPQFSAWTIAGGAISDAALLLFGAIFGLAFRRPDGSALLMEDAVFAALTLATAFSFAMAGIGKAFSLEWMIGFFHQSGYPVAFLKCIIVTEVFAALAMLVPVTILPAILVLAIDMFGAIYTHVHNGDPLNDSSGAISELIHLAVIGTLWTMRRSAPDEAPRRIPWPGIAAFGALCLVIAVIGGALTRHIAHR